MVPLRSGTIRLGEAFESLVRPEAERAISAASVRAHQLVPRDVRGAPPLADVLREIDTRLADGVLLVHQAAIDVRFLTRALRTAGIRWPKPAVVDTVDLLLRAAKQRRFIDPDAQDASRRSTWRRRARATGYPPMARTTRSPTRSRRPSCSSCSAASCAPARCATC